MKLKAISIDDEKYNLMLIEAMGAEIGIQVSSFANPREALKAFPSESFDIAFVDYMMPEIDGITVIEEIRKSAPDIPVVMITAVDDNNLMLRAIEAGSTEFLRKPVNMPEFRARTNNLLQLRRSQLLLKDRAKLLEEEVRKATEKILAREHETLIILGRVAEYKDQETGNHIARVAHYSRLIAKKAGESSESQDIIFNAAPLHDIGKIGITDFILTKPEGLNIDETTAMRKHPEIGYMILKDSESPYLQAGALISLTHHERFDGRGYPNGLKGDDIHLYGRIVAIADVFDALISKRPYKDPWPIEGIFKYLSDEKGKHFDPNLVDRFLESKEEIEAINALFSDIAPTEGNGA